MKDSRTYKEKKPIKLPRTDVDVEMAKNGIKTVFANVFWTFQKLSSNTEDIKHIQVELQR